MKENKYTIIELRFDGKLTDLYFDGSLFEIENSIKEYLSHGATEITLVSNPYNYNFSFL